MTLKVFSKGFISERGQFVLNILNNTSLHAMVLFCLVTY